MNKVGEYVMYKNGTICRISDITRQSFGGSEEREYYVLDTVSENSSRIYLPVEPVDSGIKLRHVLSREEIDSTILEAAAEIVKADGDVTASPLWRDSSKERALYFASVTESGDRVMILRLISLLMHRRDSIAKSKKKLCAADERCLASAVKLINEEFSFVLGIPRDDVAGYILNRMKQLTNE
nr:hypothetical protein [Clostridia bacterium]